MRTSVGLQVVLLAVVQHVSAYCPAFLKDTGNSTDMACTCYAYIDGAVIKCKGAGGPAIVEQLKTVQTEIRELVIEDANIIEIGPRAFRNLRIKTLNMDNNKIQSIHPDAFRDLENTLVSLSMANNQLMQIPTNALMNMNNLLVLNLRCNRIGNIDAPVFKNMSRLIELNLGCNQICAIGPSAFIDVKSTVQSLILDNNCMTEIPAMALDGFTALLGLHIQYNQIDSLETLKQAKLPSLIMLRLGGNRISVIGPGIGASVPELRYLYVNQNQMNTIVPDTLQQFKKLVIIDFSYNNIAELASGSFKSIESLMQLNLEGNTIKDIAPGAFSNTPLLLLLLAKNCLSAINPQMFQGVPFLRQLSLSENNIRLVQPLSFSHLANLHMLDLSFNKIQVIQPGALAASTHNTVLLRENPMVCAQDGYHIVQGGRPIHLLNEENDICNTDYTRDVTDSCPSKQLTMPVPECCADKPKATTESPRLTTARPTPRNLITYSARPTDQVQPSTPATGARTPNMARFWRLAKRPEQPIQARRLPDSPREWQDFIVTTPRPVVTPTRLATARPTTRRQLVQPIGGNVNNQQNVPALPPWIQTADRFKTQRNPDGSESVVVDFNRDGNSDVQFSGVAGSIKGVTDVRS